MKRANWRDQSKHDPLMRRGTWVCVGEDVAERLEDFGVLVRCCPGERSRGLPKRAGGWTTEYFVPMWEYAVAHALEVSLKPRMKPGDWEASRRTRDARMRELRSDADMWRTIEAVVLLAYEGVVAQQRHPQNELHWAWMLENSPYDYASAVRATVASFFERTPHHVKPLPQARAPRRKHAS